MRTMLATLAVLMLAGCASRMSPDEAPAPGAMPAPGETLPAPPWQAAPLGSAAVPPVLLAAWRAAENRQGCAPIAFATLAAGAGATPRAATFSGGWGVAWDRPALRSAFGVAGAGVLAADASYDAWPFERRWSDGSTAGYGPEGGTGPNQLAYLRIAGQECLYNVWSRLGREHLESLLDAIRFVAQ